MPEIGNVTIKLNLNAKDAAKELANLRKVAGGAGGRAGARAGARAGGTLGLIFGAIPVIGGLLARGGSLALEVGEALGDPRAVAVRRGLAPINVARQTLRDFGTDVLRRPGEVARIFEQRLRLTDEEIRAKGALNAAVTDAISELGPEQLEVFRQRSLEAIKGPVLDAMKTLFATESDAILDFLQSSGLVDDITRKVVEQAIPMAIDQFEKTFSG